MIYLTLIFSFLFEACFSNVIPLFSILTPLFLITSLVVLYPYFKGKRINFIIVCLICGLFYDIIYTNLPFINTITISLTGLFIIFLYNYFNYNLLNCNIIVCLTIIIYRVLCYLLLIIIDFLSLGMSELFASIYTSLISNFIYTIILYLFIDVISKLFNIKKIDKF
ncbi:MAG: hypothetical protein Q4E75_03800 [bacterium]|nr:hypothetical protein [bacterium]